MFQIIPERIEKELISSLDFPAKTLEHSQEKISYLQKALKKALKIGHTYKNKIRIVFYDTCGLKEVETTVWNSTPQNVVLKNGVTIPFNRVVDITYA